MTSPNAGGNDNNYLMGVTCTSSSNCWAAGYYQAGSNQTLTEQYNGTSWSVVTSPDVASQPNYLYSVTCTSSSNCWAVGDDGNGGNQKTLTVQYNGTSWSIVTSANVASTNNYLNSLTCTSSSNCWAVGYVTNGTGNVDQTLAEQYNGTSWSVVTTANVTTSEANLLNAITCTSSSNCWGVGYYCNNGGSGSCSGGTGHSDQTLAEQYNGTSWSTVTSPDESTSVVDVLAGVTCTSSSACLAVGSFGLAGNSSYAQSLAETYGSSWAIPSYAPGGASNAWVSAAVDGPFGYGWASNVGMSLAENGADTQVIITDESGAPVTFNLVGSTWTAPTYNVSTLTTSGGNWTYTRWNGDVFAFNSSGQLTSETDRNSNALTLAYSSGKLSTVTDAPGSRSLTFTWTGSNVTKVEDPDSQYVYYYYDSLGNLTQVKDQAGNSVYYTVRRQPRHPQRYRQELQRHDLPLRSNRPGAQSDGTPGRRGLRRLRAGHHVRLRGSRVQRDHHARDGARRRRDAVHLLLRPDDPEGRGIRPELRRHDDLPDRPHSHGDLSGGHGDQHVDIQHL